MHKQVPLALWVDRHLFRILLIDWLLVTALVVLALLAFYRTDRAYSDALSRAQALESVTQDLDNDIIEEILNTRSFLISGDEASLTRRRLAHEDVQRDFSIIMEMKNGYFKDELTALPGIIDLHDQYDAVAEQMIAMRQTGQHTEMMETFFVNSDPLVTAVQSASRALQGEVQEQLAQASSRYSQNANVVIVAIALLFLTGTALGSIFLIQNISPALKTLAYVETALVSAAETQAYHPLNLDRETAGSAQIIGAYNQLTNRLNNSTNTILKYVSFLHHEINSLLAAVVGYGYMLSDKSLVSAENDPAEYGRVIVQQTRRITQLVEDFTLAAKIEGNQFTPALIPVRLYPLLKLLVEEVQEDFAREGIHREVQLSGEAQTVIVLGDALSLESAFRKVVDNAIKFSPTGTPVNITLEVCGSPASVLIHVEDRGIGIASEDLRGLFHPFSRIKNDATRRIPGNGMGLFLASAIIQLHRGSISVQSQMGEGSVFTITLPLEK